MSDNNNNVCPCCGRHCDLSAPGCGRGKEYLHTGVIPEHKHGRGEHHREERKKHYNAADVNEKLIFNLLDLCHGMRFLYEGKGSQKRILIILNEVGAITQQKLTERLGIQPGSASEVLAKLEAAGLITRTPNELDRRTTDIKLTESGKQQALEAAKQRQMRHEEMFSCLSEDEKSELLSLLEKLSADWEQRYHDNHHHHHGHGEHHHGHDEHHHGHHNHH